METPFSLQAKNLSILKNSNTTVIRISSEKVLMEPTLNISFQKIDYIIVDLEDCHVQMPCL